MFDPKSIRMRGPRDDWVADRVNYLGGTDIAAIAGVNPFKTPRLVWMEKRGVSPPQDSTQPMVHGQNLELYIAQCYRRITGRKVHKSRLYRDRQYPFLGVNPDYEVRGESPPRLLECKTAGQWAGQEFGESGDTVPSQYLVQCMWQLAITGRAICDLAVLIGGQDLRLYTITRDEELIAQLKTLAIDWWQAHVVNGIPPPLTGQEPDTRMVNRQFPTANGDVIYANSELTALCRALRDQRTVVRQAEAEEHRLVNEIKSRMGESSTIEFPGGLILWKCDKNGSRRFTCRFRTSIEAAAVVG
jgi:putative phage-type endonuclease